MDLKIRKQILSVYIIFLLVIIGFISFPVVNEVKSENASRASKTIIVDCNGNGDYLKIQDAIDNATAGDTIQVWAGTYYENVIVNKTISLIGNGSTNTTIDGGGQGNVVYVVTNWVNISEFTMTNSGNHWPNFIAGIKLKNVKNIRIKNNNCSNNDNGIILASSINNVIFNNICNFNKYWGIYNTISNLNIITTNIVNNNGWSGIEIIESNSNRIINNTCDSNIGEAIYISPSSKYNRIIKNNCLENKYGIRIEELCNNNYIYHNNIIDNTNQAADDGNNYWNNSDHEGNYWSDYIGDDNGANGRVKGDGIGDNLIPHLSLDNYPFVNENGWWYPGIPNLNDPGVADDDGDYEINWTEAARATWYVLEEDDNDAFESPTEIYNGSGLSFEVNAKPEGTYYYRVKAYNEQYMSDWSETVDIIVHKPPSIPKNLKVEVYPTGNALNLTWSLNTDDTIEYNIEYKNETISAWEQLDSVNHPLHTYNHTDLQDDEKYYYRIQAKNHLAQLSGFSTPINTVPMDSVSPDVPTGLSVFNTTKDTIILIWDENTEDDFEGYNIYQSKVPDPSDWGESLNDDELITNEYYIDIGLDEQTTYYYVLTALDEVPNESSYSKIVFGTTTLGPHAPVINQSVKDFEIAEDTYNDTVINLYRWFKDINNDPLKFRFDGQENISVNISQENGTVVLIPKKNWNGKETITFYANDSVYEISDDVIITVIGVNDVPGPIEIVTPTSGLEVENGTGINFSAICDDPDLIYGDELTFTWSSNISGKFGEGANLTEIILPAGRHLITLNVTDSAGESTITSIEISIKADEDNGNNDHPANDDQRDLGMIIGVVVIIVIAVILILIFFMFLKKKKTGDKNAGGDKKEETANQPQPVQQQSQPTQKKFCAACGQGMKFISQNNRYYCDYCKKYD